MSKTLDDPRDASLETKFCLPAAWYREDFGYTAGMFLSGLIMVTRNRFLAWPSVLFGVTSSINVHPLRAKEGSSGANLALCVMALIASYMPLFMISKGPNTTSTPLPSS
ncbi:hypothetical protein GGX14DRAFT_358699 [Mycena pura]|uniref:Uncharacterized protein n=1 Tax=Mycena pura TaxID=153505 RepID=A0AAD6VMR5_9AGAR|nr:hypothetical protein GGX14DRAFT_358699 [Mycena pura]